MALFQRDGVWYVRKTVRGQRYRISPWTVNREHGLLRAMWNAAMQDGLVSKNPWSRLKPMHAEPRTRVLTREESAAVLTRLGRRIDDSSSSRSAQAFDCGNCLA
jgi:hypothetical protein